MLTADALNAIKAHLISSISYARYKAGDMYYTADILSASIMDDGRVTISFLIDHELTGSEAVTEVQLYDANGTLWASKAENILVLLSEDATLYRFYFTLTEN